MVWLRAVLVNYEGWSHSDLLRLRNSLPDNDPRHQMLAPYEHAAFAREWTMENPALAVPSLMVSIPGYSLAKLVGASKARTPASLSEMGQSYKGMGRGLLALMRGQG